MPRTGVDWGVDSGEDLEMRVGQSPRRTGCDGLANPAVGMSQHKTAASRKPDESRGSGSV